MTLKRSFLGNPRYENRRRIWVWIVSAVLQIIFYPGLLEIYYSRIEAYWRSGNYGKDAGTFHTQMLQATHDALCFKQISALAVIIPAIIIALEEFAYLYNKSAVDLYCSIPVSTKKKYFNTYWGGICVYIIPYLLCTAASLLIASGNRALNIDITCMIFQSTIYNIVFFLALYSLSIAIGMFTGNLIVACFAVVLASAYLDMWSGIVSGYTEAFMSSACHVFNSTLSRWSLLGSYLWVTDSFSGNYNSQMVPTAAVTWDIIWPVIVRIAATFVIAGIAAYFAYMKRPAETASRAVSTKKICIPLKILIAVPSGLLAGYGIYETSQQNVIFMVIAIIAVTILTSMILEAVFELDLHAATMHFAPAVVSLIIAMTVFGCVKSDLLGYDSYVPNAGEIESYAVYIPSLNGTSVVSPYMNYSYNYNAVYAKEHMFLKSTEAVCSLQKKSMENQKALKEKSKSGNSTEMASIYEFDVYYRMKNGSRKARKFLVDMSDDSNDAVIDKMVGNIDYVNGAYQFASDPDAMTGYGKFKLEYSNGYAIAKLDPADFHSLRNVWMEDAKKNMNYETLHNSLPCGCIMVNYSDYTAVQLPVYDSFTETLDWMSDHKADLPEKINADDIISVAVSYCDYSADSADNKQPPQTKNVVYTDKKDIEKIVPALYPQMLSIGWTLPDTMDQDYSVDVTLKSDVKYYTESWDFYCGMISGQIPAFVRERLE